MKRLLGFMACLLLASPALATDPQYGAIRVEAAPNVVHAFVSGKAQGGDATKVSKDEWNAAHTAPVELILSVPAGIVWPGQPAAVTEFCGATDYRWRANLTNFTTIRLTAQVISAGAATSALRLQYTTDTSGATGWDYLDGVSGPSVTTDATGVTVSASVSLASAAKADVLLRLVGINGDGGGGTCYSTIKAATATALAANGANCSAGNYPLGVDASGAVESCTAVPAAGITIGSTAITSGTATRILRESAGNVVTEDANLVNDGATVTVGTGISGTSVGAVINNGTSTGNMLNIQNNGSTQFSFTDANQFALPDGASGIPAISWGGNTGFWRSGGSIVTTTSGTNWFIFNTALSMPASTVVGWTSGPYNFGIDTAISRHAAGVVRSGAALAISGFMGGGAAVSSATAMPLPTGRVFHVTGTTTITSITSTNFVSGAVITLIFDGILTFTDGSNLVLAGDFVTTADDTITLVFDGTNWFETARSVN